MKGKEIEIYDKKTLKLGSILILPVDDNNIFEMQKSVEMMNHYIKSKGVQPIGPLIQYIEPRVSEDGKIESIIQYLRQISKYIDNIDCPYKIEHEKIVRNCICAKYTGPRNNFDLAYEKIKIYAFENNIQLTGCTYTIILQGDVDNYKMDIFAEINSE